MSRIPLLRRVRSALSNPGVLFSLIWQIFLIYPVMGVLDADAPTVWTVLGLVSVAAFSVTYLAAFASSAAAEGFALELPSRRGEDDTPPVPREEPLGLGYLAVMVLLAFGTVPAAGANAVVTFLPFLACFVAAAWSIRVSVPVSLALVVAGAATAVAVGGAALFIPAFLVVPIAASMVGTRIAVGLGERDGRLRRALGAAEERDRMGRDLHDVLGHTLTALTIRAQLADRLVDDDPEAAHSELRTIEQLTRTALSEMRQTVSGMRAADPEVELAGFSESMSSAGIGVDIIGDHHAVPERHAALAAWTIREAGTNIIRHAWARRVTLEFASTGLRITDDGVGIAARRGGDAAGAVGGQGLAGLERRARDEGATVTVSDAAGSGTAVEARWE